jgi:predicted acetyltransferase
MQTRRFAWSAPDDDQMWSVLCHHSVETRIAPVTQARVVDVVGALQAWKPDAGAEGRFTMQVADAHASWNEGLWQVEFGGGSVSVRPGGGDAQISLDIQALSQAYFGWPDADALRRAERLTIADERGFDAFRACLSGPIMWMNDSF